MHISRADSAGAGPAAAVSPAVKHKTQPLTRQTLVVEQVIVVGQAPEAEEHRDHAAFWWGSRGISATLHRRSRSQSTFSPPRSSRRIGAAGRGRHASRKFDLAYDNGSTHVIRSIAFSRLRQHGCGLVLTYSRGSRRCRTSTKCSRPQPMMSSWRWTQPRSCRSILVVSRAGPKDMFDAALSALVVRDFLAGKGCEVGGGDGLGSIILPRRIGVSHARLNQWPQLAKPPQATAPPKAR